MEDPTIVLLTGVAGAGKTTIGERLSEQLQWPFFDADEFHPQANIAKMSAGIPLEEEDRWPWLKSLKAKIEEEDAAGRSAIFACSALKRTYRDFLKNAARRLFPVFLKGDPPLIAERVAKRDNHFMKEEMLASQFATLEEPDDCLIVDVSAPPEEVVAEILQALGETPA